MTETAPHLTIDGGGPVTSLAAVIADMHCPYCGSGLAHELTAAAGYGVLRCACHSYPVVAGIPIVQQVDGLRSVVEFIRSHDPRRALLQALNVFRVKWARRTRWHQFAYHLASRKLVERDDLTFEDGVDLVRKPRVFADYLLHRYANPSFLAAAGVLQVLGSLVERVDLASDRPARVLDLACGAGHSSFLINHLFPELSVIAADHDFVSVYLAKRFVAPNAVHLCIDAEVPSPFADRYFDAVYCLDAFHYLKAKRAVVRELARVATRDALWLFPHLHNAMQANVTAGIPLSPEAYLSCFDLPSARLFDENQVLTRLVEQQHLDLANPPSTPQLDDAPALILIAGPGDLWRAYREFPSSLARDHTTLAINPIYRRIDAGESTELELRWPNAVMKLECAGAEAVLPRQYRLSNRLLHGRVNERPQYEPELADAVGKFVLVPLPSGYVRGQGSVT
jgi:SAM-dependent methyltransferase